MPDLQQTNDLIARDRLDEALYAVNRLIADGDGDDATLLFVRGKIYWRRGDRARATGDYAAAASLDPDGPAARALENARDINDFYNTDLYNP